MTTNQTRVISTKEEDGNPVSITALVNDFVLDRISAGCSNFDIKPVTTQTAYTAAGVPVVDIFYVVQVNYYDPTIMG